MKLHFSTLVVMSLPAALAASCSAGAATPPEAATPEIPTAVRVTLPPAWTATPSVSVVPPSPTATVTPPPAVAAARQTAALWSPIEVVAVGAGADTGDWQTIEFETGSLRLPPTFEAVDMGGFDDAIVRYMQAFAGGLVEIMEGVPTPVPGEATPTPIPLDDLDTNYDFDFLAAADPSGEADVFLISEPLPVGFDLETMMTQAVGSVEGEVEIVNREIVGGAPRDTGRVRLHLGQPGAAPGEDRLIYVIVEGDRAWTLSFQARDIEAMLPAFETAALSLAPAP
jgi:hypothetical protein